MVGNTGLHVKALAEYLRKMAGKLYKDDFTKASICIIILRILLSTVRYINFNVRK